MIHTKSLTKQLCSLKKTKQNKNWKGITQNIWRIIQDLFSRLTMVLHLLAPCIWQLQSSSAENLSKIFQFGRKLCLHNSRTCAYKTFNLVNFSVFHYLQLSLLKPQSVILIYSSFLWQYTYICISRCIVRHCIYVFMALHLCVCRKGYDYCAHICDWQAVWIAHTESLLYIHTGNINSCYFDMRYILKC